MSLRAVDKRVRRLDTATVKTNDVALTISMATAVSSRMVAATARGTEFEALTSLTLSRFGISLRRCGGPHDGGIDLSGFAQEKASDVPSFNVFAQCKAERLKIGATALRELEGTLMRIPSGTAAANNLGILISASGFSLPAIRYGLSSQNLLLLLHLDALTGRLLGALPSRVASSTAPLSPFLSSLSRELNIGRGW